VSLVEQELLTLPEHTCSPPILSGMDILIGTTSSQIQYQLRDVYSICRCCWSVATYEWKVHNGNIEIISFAVFNPWGPTLFADLFLYSYEADFIQGLLKKNENKLARSLSFTFRCIDDVLSLNNSRFYIYSMCRCCWNVATYKWKVHKGKLK
jgi:hypothetical protein